MNEVIPTVFAKSKDEFDLRFKKLIGISKKLQIDFMDGKLVESKGIGIQDVLDLKRYDNEFEAHLMVENPGKWISECKKKGFVKVIFHFEAVSDKEEIMELVEEIRSSGMKAFMAINPETPIKKVIDFLDLVDGILVMGVHPGKEGQELDENIFSRIKEIRKKNKKIDVQVDGGVKPENIGMIAKAGANLINTGSFVGKAENPKAALQILKNKVK